jgi:hypothetical protein
MNVLDQPSTFSAAIALEIEALGHDPADTARQVAIARIEATDARHDVVLRIRRGEEVELGEALATEARAMLAETGGILVRAFGTPRYEDACDRAERIAVMLDETARAIREYDPETTWAVRSEIETALADFGATLS